MPRGFAAFVAGFLFLTTGAKAQAIIDLSQVGSNVVMTLDGSIDTFGLTYSGPEEATGNGIVPGLNILSFNPLVTSSVDAYTGFSGPSNFGYNVFTNGSSGFGSIFVFDGFVLALPSGYLSGTALSATEIFNDTTIVALGLIPSIYDYTWSGGFFQIDIGQDVPEPAMPPIFGAWVGVLICFLRFNWKTAAAASRSN